MDVQRIQESLRNHGLDGWLLYNFQGINSIAARMVTLPEHVIQSRRFFYFIPAEGTPRKLVHRIEDTNLDHLPGEKTIYISWQSLAGGLHHILRGSRKIAMEYSPRSAIPYVSRVDAGTVELVRSIDKEVVSSANLIQEFESRLSQEQIDTHALAARLIRQFVENAFDEIHSRIVKSGEVKEYVIQQFLMRRFGEHNLVTDHPPIVAVNAHAGNPHYSPTERETGVIRTDSLVLLDIFAKQSKQNAIYADITWMGYTGKNLPEEYETAFGVIAQARDAAFDLVSDRFSRTMPLEGWEVDDTARRIITEAGYGDYFIHRTGHSIGEEVHGNGANIDNFETHDERRIIARTCFSIEPGIYTDTYGVRTEIDVFVSGDGGVECTGGPPQREIIII